MKSILYSVLAVAITIVISSSSANAQDYSNSYRFGLGFNYGTNLGNNVNHGRFGPLFSPRGISRRVAEPPYFAKHPPVYYSGIVRRPYGISPYATPPGIMPAEMNAPKPVTISNPFYDKQAKPVVTEKKGPPANPDNQSTSIWVKNPFSGDELVVANR